MHQEQKPEFDWETYFNSPDGPQLLIESLLWVRTKRKGVRPFWLNNIQKWYLKKLVKKYWKPFQTSSGTIRYRFEGIREICLKARQFGLSTLICAIFFFNALCNESTTVAVFCQDDKASKKMLKKYKLFYDRIPAQLKPELTVNNVTTMEFAEMSSIINSLTPGSSRKTADKQGRSETITDLHCSEFAEWAEAEAAFGALEDTVPDEGNIIIESSPKRVGDYLFKVYQDGKKKLSAWMSRFFPWYKFSENKITKPKELKRWLTDAITADEKQLIEKYGWTEEQLAWRRKKIAKKFGDLRAFLREHPENDRDCFESEMELVFPETVRHHFREYIENLTAEILKGIEKPKPGHIYCIGVDPCGGGTHSDNAGIVIIDATERVQIFEKHLIIKPKDLIPVVFSLWEKYPGFVGIESNNEVGLSAIDAAKEIPEWFGYLFKNNQKRGGFWTGEKKRSFFDAIVKELLQVSQGFEGLILTSMHLVNEMNWFQVLPDGSYGAPPRTSESKDNENDRLTDDSLMALMIAYVMLRSVYLIREKFFEDFVLPELKKNPKLFEKDEKLKIFYENQIAA